jgi:hypothetical protein
MKFFIIDDPIRYSSRLQRAGAVEALANFYPPSRIPKSQSPATRASAGLSRSVCPALHSLPTYLATTPAGLLA